MPESLKKMKRELVDDPAIPTPGYIPKGSKICMLSGICSSWLMAALFKRAEKKGDRGNTNCLLTDKYIDLRMYT